MRPARILTVAAISVAAAAGVPGGVTAADAPFGQHVAMCAHELGQRADAPAVTCSHDGMTMTFASFGVMVQHMRGMH